jgi:quinol monooxygenase YgiN
MAASVTTDVAVVELRQYTLVPGRRDDMIAIFERHFIESQEEAGMRLLGHFRDLGDPNRFVWLRGFRDMPSRRAALEAFYGSELWFEHRDAVNETIVDSDDVLLLRPAAESSPGARPSHGGGPFTATIWPFAEPVSPDTIAVFADELDVAGATTVALLVTEPSENDFPRLPVREGESVVVWLGRVEDAAALEGLDKALEGRLAGRPQTLRLAPCARSAIT